MSVFTKRNAAVGYVTLKALESRLGRRKRRSGLKMAGYVALGVLSAGILAAVLAVLVRRRQGDSDLGESFESDLDSASDIVGEYVTAPEPLPAT